MLKQEIFAVGTWNGFPFSLNDLRKMAQSFMDLGEVLKVPLKLGHNDEQDMTDGQPALGWVTAMEVVENKLVATFEDVPPIMMEAFEKKLYRSVSIELDFDVQHKGRFYDFVVTAVALLGADMPAVNVLNDLASFMSRNSNLIQSGYAAGNHSSFNTISGNRQEQSTMTPEEEAKLRKQLAEAQATAATATANFSALETTSKSEKDASDARLKQIEDDQKSTKVEAARVKFTTMLEDAVKAKDITPAQRESFAKVLRLDDDDAVLSLKEEDVQALFGASDDKSRFNKDTGKGQDEDTGDDVGSELATKAHQIMSGNPGMDFSKALNTAMLANPEMAREYIDSNGEVEY